MAEQHPQREDRDTAEWEAYLTDVREIIGEDLEEFARASE